MDLQQTKKYYHSLRKPWVPKRIGWHQWRFQIDGKWKKFYFTNKGYHLTKLRELCPETVYYSTIMHLAPRKYRSSKERLPGYAAADNLILGGFIAFDFDYDNLEKAREETYKFLQFLKKKLDVVYILCTAHRGFHIVTRDPFKLPIKASERRIQMQRHRKLFIEQLITEYGRCPFDRPIAEDIYRFIRVPGTINKHTGFIATIISEEILSLPLEEFIDNIPHVSGERPEIPLREMTINLPHNREGDGKRPGQSFHLQTFITNKVIGTKDRFIPIFQYKQKEPEQIERIMHRLIRTYKLTNIYMFRDEDAHYALSLKTFQKRRLQKIMKASNADNRTHRMLRMPISPRVTEEGQKVYNKPEYLGMIASENIAFISASHNKFFNFGDKNKMHGTDGIVMTKSRIRVN